MNLRQIVSDGMARWRSKRDDPDYFTFAEPADANNNMKVQSYLSCDLGQQRDYTALSVVRRVQVGNNPPVYEVPWLKRFPLLTSYVDIVAAVKEYLFKMENPIFCLDRGGCGIPVADMFIKAGLPAKQFVQIMIHGGVNVSQERGVFGVPKCDLVGTLLRLLEEDRLTLSKKLKGTKDLIHELHAFEAKTDAKTGHETFSARSSAHDDILMSLSMACWHGERGGRREFRLL